jgi:hypothetical protein
MEIKTLLSGQGPTYWSGEAMPLQPERVQKVETLYASNSHCRTNLPFPPTLLWMPVVTAMAGLLPTRAWAHVKWFAPYDVSQQPTSVNNVLTGHFVMVFLVFTLLLASTFLLDWISTTWCSRLAAPGDYEEFEEKLLRSGTGAFFMALFATGGIILTPELRTTADWSTWLQLGIAVTMLSERTCALGSLGILALYGFGVAQYGFFHLSDYPMFIGLAAYLALTSVTSKYLRSLRMPILYVSICVTLMWGAVEKWAYPEWTFPLLAERPYLTFGLPPDLFMIVAGFVEFTFAFYMLTGFALLRLAVLGLGTIFAAAIIDFGKPDAIGHLPILIAMAAMFLHGPTPLHFWLHETSDSGFRKARTAGIAYASSVFLFLALYYGLQYSEFGHGASGHKIAMSEAPASTL